MRLNHNYSLWLVLMQWVAVFCRHRVTAHLKQDCTVGCNWWWEEMKRVKSNQTAAHSVVLTLASLPDFSNTGKGPLCLHLALPCLSCLSPSRSTSRNLYIWTSPPHLLIFTSPYCISHLSICPSCCSAMYEKVLACWLRPQEVSFPLKHNYPTLQTRASHWWPRNTSKWHGKLKKDWAEFMNFNSNPNSYSSSYSYLQAIFNPFSLRSAGPTLLSWHRDEKKWQASFDLW